MNAIGDAQRLGHTLFDDLQAGLWRVVSDQELAEVRFGDTLKLVALGGEVVVDNSLRLKREMTGESIWVAGYSNDNMGYIPSARVLREGGI